jgi:hypothetical protein
MTSFLAIAAILVSQLSPLEGSPFTLPLAYAEIVSQYVSPSSPYTSGHRGIDIAGNLAEIVFAPNDGTILFNGQVGFRNVLTLSFGENKVTMEPVCSNLAVGEKVTQGSEIGSICQIDQNYKWHCPNCLHLGLITPSGYLSPEYFLGTLPASRLKP